MACCCGNKTETITSYNCIIWSISLQFFLRYVVERQPSSCTPPSRIPVFIIFAVALILLSAVSAQKTGPIADVKGLELADRLQALVTRFRESSASNITKASFALADGLCEELCKQQMGGVACPCDLLPIGK